MDPNFERGCLRKRREILSRWCDYKEGRYKDKRSKIRVDSKNESMDGHSRWSWCRDKCRKKRTITTYRPGYMSIDRMEDWTLWSVSLEISWIDFHFLQNTISKHTFRDFRYLGPDQLCDKTLGIVLILPFQKMIMDMHACLSISATFEWRDFFVMFRKSNASTLKWLDFYQSILILLLRPPKVAEYTAHSNASARGGRHVGAGWKCSAWLKSPVSPRV